MSMCVAQIRRPASKIKVHSSHSVHQFGRTSWSMKSQWCSPTWQEANLQEKPPMSPMSSDEEKNQKAIEVNEVDWVIVGCKSFKPLWKSHMDIGRGRSRRRWTKIMERRIRKEVESEWPHHKHSKHLIESIVGCKSFKPLWKSHIDIGRGRSRRRWTKRRMERRIRKDVESEWPHHKHSKTLDWVNCWMQTIQAPLEVPHWYWQGQKPKEMDKKKNGKKDQERSWIRMTTSQTFKTLHEVTWHMMLYVSRATTRNFCEYGLNDEWL